uniref:Uncharacterized protein n=1 Tax=Arundo donax TaxID=35708 RepID=A0A0A9HKX6_ARUDO
MLRKSFPSPGKRYSSQGTGS